MGEICQLNGPKDLATEILNTFEDYNYVHQKILNLRVILVSTNTRFTRNLK